MEQLTTAQVAERLGVHISTVIIWCKRGLLPGCTFIGPAGRGMWLIPEEALERFVRPRRGRPRKDSKR